MARVPGPDRAARPCDRAVGNIRALVLGLDASEAPPSACAARRVMRQRDPALRLRLAPPIPREGARHFDTKPADDENCCVHS
jgi:hypothetical protein